MEQIYLFDSDGLNNKLCQNFYKLNERLLKDLPFNL